MKNKVTGMDTTMSVNRTLNIIRKVALACRAKGGPLTNQLVNLLMQKRYLEVIDFEIDYTWHFAVDDFLYARQVQALIQKVDFLDLGFDRSQVTLDKFLRSERICREANHRIDENRPSADVSAVIHYAIEKISSVLGDAPSLADLKPTFGPGANTSVSGVTACARTKLSAKPVCNESLITQLQPFVKECAESLQESWNLQNVVVGAGVRAEVPKSSKENRSIVIEPVISSFGQKAIGKKIRQKLLYAGIDLRDQSKNQKAARRGSITDDDATVDLTMASDCVARNAVWLLVRYDWACLLDTFRTESILIRDPADSTHLHGPYLLEKFSSMGNGFTFELESLIFYGITFGVCKALKLPFSRISVYGDDIIVPSAGYDLLVKVLTYFGFSVNLKKSYTSGPFRESCGADYLRGIDIRPFYINGLLSYFDLFSMHNFFVRRGEPYLASIVLSFIPSDFQLWGPDAHGDGHLVGEWEPYRSKKKRERGYEGGVFDTYVRKNKKFFKRLKSDWILPCYTVYAANDLNEERLCSESEYAAYVILENLGFSAQDLGIYNPILGNGRLQREFIDSHCSDPYTIRGDTGYKKISIYTLWRGIFFQG